MNKQTNTNIFRRVTSVGVLCIALLGSVACSPKKVADRAPVQAGAPSRITVLEVASVGGDTFTLFRDKETGRDYVYIDGYNSGCVVELRAK